MSTWLLTGGAGYIGAHVAREFLDNGTDVVVIDDLSSGRREFVPSEARFVEASIEDAGAVREALAGCEGVVHLGGLKYAGVSVRRPLDFWRVNVEGTRTLVEECVRADVRNVVYSSSAAVFGVPDTDLVDESTPRAPLSPYGESKLAGEWLLRDVQVAEQLEGRAFRHVSLRYFNVVGASVPGVYDVSPHNLFPLVLDAVNDGRRPKLLGDDYATPDGSCVRDYIHVADVASAHVAAANALVQGDPLAPAYNLGRGEGVSVKEIFAAFGTALGRPLEYDVEARRPGDPDRIVTSADRARADLGWTATRDLDEMVRSACEAAGVAVAP